MRQRHLFIGILLLALMLRAWGSLLGAAFCPHMAQDEVCCHLQNSHHPAAHKEMMEMPMGDMQIDSVAGLNPAAHAFSQPHEACSHCMGHSQLPAPCVMVSSEAEQTKRSADAIPPVATAEPVSSLPAFARHISARVHAPPRLSISARHILISVFRI